MQAVDLGRTFEWGLYGARIHTLTILFHLTPGCREETLAMASRIFKKIKLRKTGYTVLPITFEYHQGEAMYLEFYFPKILVATEPQSWARAVNFCPHWLSGHRTYKSQSKNRSAVCVMCMSSDVSADPLGWKKTFQLIARKWNCFL